MASLGAHSLFRVKRPHKVSLILNFLFPSFILCSAIIVFVSAYIYRMCIE